MTVVGEAGDRTQAVIAVYESGFVSADGVPDRCG